MVFQLGATPMSDNEPDDKYIYEIAVFTGYVAMLGQPQKYELPVIVYLLIAGSLESANSSILAARRHFKEVVGKKIRILL